jgi:hypothetical protein
MSQQLIYKIKYEYKDADILACVRVVYHEWEMDGWVALARIGSNTYLFGTNHGGLEKLSLKDGRTLMRDQIRETQSMVDDMKDFQGKIKEALDG